MITGENSPFLGMVKTARLVIDQCLFLVSWHQAAVKGGEDIDLDGRMTRWTWDEI
jgi:hypothetical protein